MKITADQIVGSSITYGGISGVEIKFPPSVVVEGASALNYATLVILLATAAIALGLNKEEAAEFGRLAYGRCRGKLVAEAYEDLITLAYEIKGRNG